MMLGLGLMLDLTRLNTAVQISFLLVRKPSTGRVLFFPVKGILDEPPNVMLRVLVPKTENKTYTAMQKHEGVLFLARARAPAISNAVEWSKEPRAQIYSSIYRF